MEVRRKKLSWWRENLRKLGVPTHVGWVRKEGWSGEIELWSFRCDICHQITEDYIKGYDKRVECPNCKREIALDPDEIPW